MKALIHFPRIIKVRRWWQKLHTVLGIFRETKPIWFVWVHVCISDLLWRIGLCGYGDWEVPQPAICRLRTQESKGYNSSQSLKTLETREPMVWVLVQVQKPENLRADGLSPSLRTEEDQCPCSNSHIQAPDGQGEAHHPGEGNRHYSFYWFKHHPHLETLSQTLRIMLNQISRHPLTQWSWHTKVTITGTVIKHNKCANL